MDFIMKLIIKTFLDVDKIRDLVDNKFFPWLKAKAASTEPEYDDALVDAVEVLWSKIGDGLILKAIEAVKKNLG